MIELENLSVNLRTFRLESLSMRIAPREFFMIVGPNGAGKKILLESIAGLRSLAGRRVRIRGLDVAPLPPERGNVALARKITDLGGTCDAFFSADCMVIEKLLRPATADWNILFASNVIVLMYGPKSKYGDEALYERAMKHSGRGVRQKAIELVSMVESGAMDYAFEYKSVAVQHGLKYLDLPPKFNLMEPSKANGYAAAKVELAGKEPGKKMFVKGEPIIYGLSIPKDAPDADGALEDGEFVLSPEGGLAVFQEMGQDIVGPKAMGADESIPAALKALLKN